MDIVAQIRLLRASHGMTLQQVAEATGLSVSYLSDIERGRTTPSIETLSRIAACHDVKLYIGFVGDVPDTVRVRRSELEHLYTVIGGLLAEDSSNV